MNNQIKQNNTIEALIQKFEDVSYTDENGLQYWYARELQQLLEYAKWENFEKTILKAKNACQTSGFPVENHFPDVRKMVTIGSDTKREIKDIKLSRYACYLIAQNSDSTKEPVAFAQTYFAIQTRRQELSDEAQKNFKELSEEEKRVILRNDMKEHNKQLVSTAKKAGVETNIDYAIFQNAGYKGLNEKQPILDYMGSTELAANLFKATQTEEKLKRENVKGKQSANKTHYEVGKKVRNTMKELGNPMPEDLPIAEDIKKVERKMKKKKLENK